MSLEAKPPLSESFPRVEVFRNAPVVEAICWLEFPTLDNLEDTLLLLGDDLGESFLRPEKWSGGIATTGLERRVGRSGYVFKSTDEAHRIRLQRTRFSFHRLPPYADWSDLEAGARAAWEHFVRRYEPEYISRFGLRYLNRIVTPPVRDLADYVTFVPSIPAVIDTGYGEYLMRLVLRDDTVPGTAEIMQLARSVPGGHHQMTFDIEVGGEREYSTDDPELWAHMCRLRDYKNRIFFSSITDECRELFR